MKKNDYSNAFWELTKYPDEIKVLSSSFETGTIRVTAFYIIPGIFLSSLMSERERFIETDRRLPS